MRRQAQGNFRHIAHEYQATAPLDAGQAGRQRLFVGNELQENINAAAARQIADGFMEPRRAAGINYFVGAQFPRHFQPLPVDVNGDNPRPGQLRHLQSVQPHAAHAHAGHRLAGTRLRPLDHCVVRSRHGVAQDAGVLQRHIVRGAAQVDAGGLDVLGKAAVHREPVLAQLWTKGVAPLPAVFAHAAGEVKVDRHPVAGGEAGHFRAHCRHFAGDFVAHNQGNDAQPHPVGADFKVGAADAHIAHAHQRLVRRNGRRWHFFGDERAVEPFQYQSSHLRFSCRRIDGDKRG